MAIDPVKATSDATNTSLEQQVAQRLGFGVVTGAPQRVDPTTGQITAYQPATPAGYTSKNGAAVGKGPDGRYYDLDPVTGKPTGAPYAAGYVEKYFTPSGGSAAGWNPTGSTDAGWQINQGVTDAARLDPNNNLALMQAGASANDLASGNVGRALGQQVNAGMSATQGRIDAQAGDLGIVRNSALGQGPSAAEALAKSQLDANIRSQSAMAATARGGNIAAAMRQAADSGTQQSLQSAQTMAALRAQEQLNAQGLLTTGANNLTNAQGNLGAQRQSLASMQGGLIQSGQQGQANVAGQYGNDVVNQNAAKQAAAAQYAQYLSNLYATSAGIQPSYGAQSVQAGIANQNNTTQLIGALANAGGAATAAAFGH